MTTDQTKRPTIRVGEIAVVSGTLRGALVVNRVLDPTDLIIGGAKALKGFKLDDVLAGLRTNLSDLSSGLSTSLRGIDIDVDIELPGTNRGDGGGAVEPGSGGVRNDDPAVNRGGGDDTAATNNVNRDVDVSNEHPRSEQPTNTNQSETPAQQPVVDLVREHELVGAGAPGSPSTHHGGGRTQLIDNGGSSHGGSGGGGDGTGGSAHGGGTDHASGTGAGGDGPGGPGGPGHGAPGDGSGAHGGTPGDKTPDSPLGNAAARQDHYGTHLSDVLTELGIPQNRFETLVNTPYEQLSKADLDTLVTIRDRMPDVTPDTVLQKLIPPSDVHKLFDDMLAEVAKADVSTPEGAALVAKFDDFVRTNPDIFDGPISKYSVDSVGGFVSRTSDVSDLDTKSLYESLGLKYPGTEFNPTGQDYFAVEFRAENISPSHADYTLRAARDHYAELDGLTGFDYQYRLAELVETDFRSSQPSGPLSMATQKELDGRIDFALRAVDPDNVHRGNGFGGQGQATSPELQLFSRQDIPEGAELWKITPAGDRISVATYINDTWILN